MINNGYSSVRSPLLLRAGLNYQLRHRWQASLALVGIIMGVAVVLAVDLANAAARASFALSAEQLRGTATHRIIANSGKVSEVLFSQLFTTPGHPPIAPVITTRVRLSGQSGRFKLIGLDLFAEGQFRPELPGTIRGEISLAQWLSDPAAVSLSQSASESLGVGTGSQLTVRHQGLSSPLKVIAISSNDSVTSRDLLVVDIATAQAVTGLKGHISFIDLILNEDGKTWINNRLPETVKLVSIDDQTEGIVGLSASFELNLTAMSLLALLVGLFLIFNAMSFSVVQRRKLFGRLRAIGVHSHEINRVILAEAFVLGVIGTIIGFAVGTWLGQGLTKIVASTVSELYYEVSADAMQISWLSFVKAGVLGLVGTLVASWLPARQAASTPVLTTLSRSALESFTQTRLPILAIAGLLMVVIGLLVAFYFPGGVISGFAGLFFILLGFALITPLGLPLAYKILTQVSLGGVWHMAVRDLNRHVSRLGTASAALMVALAATVGVAIMVDSMRTSVSDWLQGLLTADLYIAAEGFEENAHLPGQVQKAASQLTDVSAFSLYRDNKVQLGGLSTHMVAAQLAKQSQDGFDLVETDGSNPWSGFQQGEVMISEPLAYRLELKAGDPLLVSTPQGERSFQIAAIFRDYASEHGRLFIDLQYYRQHWTDSYIDKMALFSETVDGSDLKKQMNGLFDDNIRLEYTDAQEIYKESMAVFDRTFRITEVLRLLSILVAFIGILTALMAVQLERSKEFAVLRALGVTPSQVSLLIVIESTIVGLLAAIISIPAGLALAWVLTDGIQHRAFGWTMPFLVSVEPLGWTLLLGLCSALLASVYPAWQAGRGDPAPYLRED